MSPSLLPRRAVGPAYEVKFLLREEQAQAVESGLIQALTPDPHCDPALGGMYAITSLACDDAEFGVFFREERMRDRKYRVRRYGASTGVFVERKHSRRGRVRKRRAEAPLEDLEAVAVGHGGGAAHAWFAREVRSFDVAPVCRVRYLRRALFGVCAGGAMRATFDRSIRGSLATGWTMDARGEERVLLDGLVVCEFKFHNAMPGPMLAVCAARGLTPGRVSKYRSCVAAFAPELGLDPARAREAAATMVEARRA